MSDTIINEQAEKLAAETTDIALKFSNYGITTQEEYTGAAEVLKVIKQKAAQLEDMRKSMTGPLDQAKKKIMDFFRAPGDALARAEATIKGEIIKYQREQERIRKEQERKLQEQARAEEEKQRQALLKKAEKAEAKGNAEKAAELQEQAATVFVPAPVVAPSVPKVAGVAMKTVWEFEIIDASAIPREYLAPDLVKIGAVVRAMKGTSNIPGIRTFQKEVISSSRRG